MLNSKTYHRIASFQKSAGTFLCGLVTVSAIRIAVLHTVYKNETPFRPRVLPRTKTWTRPCEKSEIAGEQFRPDALLMPPMAHIRWLDGVYRHFQHKYATRDMSVQKYYTV